MKIVIGPPPNMAAIENRFGLIKPGAYFCYGDVIYTRLPRQEIDLGVVRHETVHSRQQRAYGGSEKWWARYLEDPSFRREQEIEAYRAQVAFYRLKLPRRVMRQVVLAISKEMAGPMYGRMITRREAVEMLENSAKNPQMFVPVAPLVKLEVPPEWDAPTSEPLRSEVLAAGRARENDDPMFARLVAWLKRR